MIHFLTNTYLESLTSYKTKQLKIKPLSVFFLSLSGFLLMGMGIYFIFLRPLLLPEDAKYMNSSISEIQNTIPHLTTWLQKVFWVMGGYILTTVFLTIYIAQTSFRTRAKGVFSIVLITSLTSIGFIAMVNFMLQSGFQMDIAGL